MSLNRRQCLVQFLGLTAAGLSGCASRAEKPFTVEVVSSVLVSQDNQQVVVMTQDYHYVFGLPAAAFAALQADFHPYVDAVFSDFQASANGQVRGLVTLTVGNAHPDAVASAVAAGFKRNSDGAFFKTTLRGERYKAGGVQPMQAYRLNKMYFVRVEGSGDAGPTPIGVVGGVMVLSAIALYVLFHPKWPQ